MSDVVFVSNVISSSLGSYRIWVEDLSFFMKELGIDVAINSPILKGTRFIILGKDDFDKVDEYKKKYSHVKIGIINPSPCSNNADFVIVGSIEEMAGIAFKENVFLYPLIERMYMKCHMKIHVYKETLQIGYHGHFAHLAKFEPHLKVALEKFHKEYPIELVIISDKINFPWLVGKPDIPIKFVQWNYQTIKEDIYMCDIGIVPNITNINPNKVSGDINLGLHDTDYFFRLKHKSNAGRAFVFVQVGIPVIADLTPSNLHLFGNPNCGYIAVDHHGWLKGFRELKYMNKRIEVAKNAKNEFDRLYDPIEWTKNLYSRMEALYD